HTASEEPTDGTRSAPGARVRLRIVREGGLVLVLLAVLFAAHAASAHVAPGPFIPIDLGTLGGGAAGRFAAASWAAAMSSKSQVVGSSYVPDLDTAHAFSWTRAGGMIDLGTLGGSSSFAVAVSDGGQVVGSSYSAGGEVHAFSWTEAGGMIDLGTFGGFFTSPSAVNAS